MNRVIVALTPTEVYRGKGNPLVRVQLSCLYSEAFGSLDCDCARQLDASLAMLNKAGEGVLIYFPNTDARGLGLSTKVMLMEAEQSLHLGPFRAARASDVPYQNFDCLKYVPRVLAHLQIKGSVRLLSNNPQKERGLVAAGLTIESMVPLAINENDLSAEAREEMLEKRTLLGHLSTSVDSNRPSEADSD